MSEAKNDSAAASSAEVPTDRSYGSENPGLVAGVGERLRPVLSPVIAVENDSVRLSAASADGRDERVGDELGPHVIGHRPARQATGEHVDGGGQVQEFPAGDG